MSGLRDAEAFVRAQTAIAAPPLVPELRLHLATEVTPLWQATEAVLARTNLPPPYWAFAWPGGQALARYVLDHPDVVRGRAVLDFAAGSGIGAIAAAKAGAARVTATDIDAHAAAAMRLNAAANGVTFAISTDDLTRADDADDGVWDVVLAGDVCYERPMAEAVLAWLRRQVGRGAVVLMADPGRAYLPSSGLVEIARYDVPTSPDLEDRPMRTTRVLRLLAQDV
ncbi:MAG TPA: 50S ribosomal protein L11 methyltransferase [Alphaproteobacteria bacterium]